jgi:SpoVK/Ycf46/Vps4 family AAA+-type ATPase
MNVADIIITNRLMPDRDYEHLWDSIIVEQSIKDRLLRTAALSLQLRSRLPFETTALHGLALLYGPPGTGKTTLARGLAQQLAPLTAKKKARLIEVNPHGLMSAEHGQSQRRVTDLDCR